MRRFTLRFIIGFIVGLGVGVFFFVPVMIFMSGIMTEVLHMPGHISANKALSVELPVYAIWLLMVWGVLWLVGKVNPDKNESPRRFPFFHGLLSSFPLTVIYIAYVWRT